MPRMQGPVKLSLEQVRELAGQVGFPDPCLAAAVAMAESGGDILAQGDPHGPSQAVPNGVSKSFGLWQIYTPAWPQFPAERLLEPVYNARAALHISKQGTDFNPWTTYKTGAYKQFLPAEAST